MAVELRPIRLLPAFKDYLWGGTRLKTEFGMDSALDRVAEAWVLSCHPDGPSVVASGECAGMTLGQYLERAGDAALGTRGVRFGRFPVLIKLIDARERLSIQVHPDDAYARRVEGESGKTELWYVMDCSEGASLVYGFAREVTREEFSRRIGNNTLSEVVNIVPVHRGDVFLIEAGTLHAIGGGILIAEIQQNSNCTYRVYDYGRLGADGAPRPLHIDKALDVTRREPAGPHDRRENPERLPDCTQTVLTRCDSFTVTELELDGTAERFAGAESFQALLCIEGEAQLHDGSASIRLDRGGCVFIPAGCGAYTLSGRGRLLCTTV